VNEFLDIAPEVATALSDGRAVVALESTIIAHGMPYPQNLAMARAIEGIVRGGGAVPATIAIIGGRLKVGLDAAGLELLARADGVAKASTRDIAYLVATRGHGATTVAATMRIAALAGIPVFATGGIGGVHRGAAASFDISASPSSRRAPNRSSTSARRWSSWRRWRCRSWSIALTSFRRSTRARAAIRHRCGSIAWRISRG